jgi:ABC-type lipoprotein release transport system permease subunit
VVVVAVVGLLLHARFRRRWLAWLSLSLLVALASGLVLAGVAAGRRTAAAFPRYVAAYGYDAFVVDAAPVPKIAALAGVVSATPVPTIGDVSSVCGCFSHPVANYLTVAEAAARDLPHLVKLVAGRMPDEADPHQVLASFTLAQDGVHIGAVIRVRLPSASQRSAVLSGAYVLPAGPAFAFRVVGIEANEAEFPATSIPAYDLVATRAFARLVNPKTFVFPSYRVRLRRGPADFPRFVTQARRLGGVLAVDDLATEASAVASSIHPQAVGWWILSGLAALAGILVVAQALTRRAAIEAGDTAILSALGAGRRQLVAVGMATTLVIAVAGVVGGVALAFLLSPLAPLGEARLADPSPGFAFDGLVLLPGALAAVIVVLALGLWPAVRAARPSHPAAAAWVARSSRIVAMLAGAGAPPSALIGVRHALEQGRGRSAVPAGSALLGSVLAVTALCATAVFGASLTHLIRTPALYGQLFDLEFSPDTAASPAQLRILLTGLQGNSAISDITAGSGGESDFTAGAGGDVSIDGHIVKALAGQSLRGSLLFTAISGRLPDAADQVALGATTLRQLGAHVGSLVRVTAPRSQGGSRTATYRVVGTAVFPPDFGTGGLGTGALFTLGGLLGTRCAPGPAQQACQLRSVISAGGPFLVRAAPGPRGHAALTWLTQAYPQDVNFPVPPTNLVNFGEAVNFPLLFGVLLILFAAGTLVHLLVVSVVRRRWEVGLLKALGFIRRQVAFSLLWQTTTIAVAGIAIGVPAGIAAGRLIWQAFASSLGVLPVPVVTGWVIAAVAIGTVLAANVLAAGPAAAASRSRPASLLKTE